MTSARRQPLRFALAWLLTSLAVFAVVVTFARGGTMEREATLFILQYTGDRPLPQKIFDPYANDLGTYQARELSYLVDYADAVVYRFIYRTFGAAVFIPFSSLIVTLLSGFVFFRGVARATRLDPFTSALVFGCFATSFVFLSTMSVFYRSGKLVLAVVLLALLFQLRSVYVARAGNQAPGRWLTRDAAVTGGLALVAGLLDRQGVFYVGACFVLLAVHPHGRRHMRDVLLGLAVALAALHVYNVVLGPMLVAAINGYRPDLQYQSLPREHLWRLPIYAILATQMLVENVALVFGGSGTIAAILLASAGAAVGVSAILRQPREGRSRELRRWLRFEPDRRVLICWGLAFGLQIVMFALMIARHPFVYASIDHRYWYYTLPFVITILFGAAIAIDTAVAGGGGRVRDIIRVGLVLAILANLATTEHHRNIMAGGEWFSLMSAQSDVLRRSLSTGVPHPLLQTEYSRFFRYHQRIREGATSN